MVTLSELIFTNSPLDTLERHLTGLEDRERTGDSHAVLEDRSLRMYSLQKVWFFKHAAESARKLQGP